MKLQILMIVTILVGLAAADWCPVEQRTYYAAFDRDDPASKAFRSTGRAKKVCDRTDGCIGVGVDRVPYKRKVGGEVVHTTTIYLITDKNVEFDVDSKPVAKSNKHYRYYSYLNNC